MYSIEKKEKAIELYIRYDLSAATVIRELGYPDRKTLRQWYRDSLENNGEPRIRGYTIEQQRNAVNHYLSFGKNYNRTVRSIGYPTRETLRKWVRELAPEECKTHKDHKQYTQTQKVQAVTARYSNTDVGQPCSAASSTLNNWKSSFLPDDRRVNMRKRKTANALPDDREALLSELEQLQNKVQMLRMECDLLEGAADLLKKEKGVNLTQLTNKEKRMLIDALRIHYPLKALMGKVEISSSSYYYQRSADRLPGKYDKLKEHIREIFTSNYSCYGYLCLAIQNCKFWQSEMQLPASLKLLH